MVVDIHPSAVVSPGAVLGDGTSVGPYTVIGPNVVLGKGNRVGSHVVIEGNTRIGDENNIFQFASVGSRPQDLKYHGEPSTLEIGNRNIIREYVTLQPGTEGGGMRTVIGDDNLFMVTSHIGHDCVVGNRNVIANAVAVAGHVTIGNGAILGGLVAVHQFVRIGDLALISGGSMVIKDVPPFCMAQGDRATLAGINQIGLKRAKFSEAEIHSIKKVYRDLFLGDGVFKTRLENCLNAYKSDVRTLFLLNFVKGSERGVTTPLSRNSSEQDSAEK